MTRQPIPPAGAVAELLAGELSDKAFGSGGEQAIPRPFEPPPAPQPLQFPRPDWQAEAAERARLERQERDRLASAEVEKLEDVEHLPARPARNPDRLAALLHADRRGRMP